MTAWAQKSAQFNKRCLDQRNSHNHVSTFPVQQALFPTVQPALFGQFLKKISQSTFKIPFEKSAGPL
jgi:hypothetical protein